MTSTGHYMTLHGEKYYLIEHFDRMSPFFISLASDTDLWMYISSTGGLSCGRRNPEQALFPYYTDDKITENADHTGAKTIIRLSCDCLTANADRPLTLSDRAARCQTDIVSNSELVGQQSGRSAQRSYSAAVGQRSGLILPWEPFSDRYMGVYRTKRSIAKSVVGNRLLFMEQNLDLGLTFTYEWMPAGQWGWVRRATLRNDGTEPVSVEMIDGLQNVLPSGVEQKTQNVFSTLVDAYKKTETLSFATLFRMEAILVDRAEPSESLRCNAVFTLGLPEARLLASSRQLDAFRMQQPIADEPESKGVRGAALAHAVLTLEAGSQRTWYEVCDVALDATEVRARMQRLAQSDAVEEIEKAVQQTTDNLRAVVGQNDGIQQTADEAGMARHFANTLFNTMRGGFYCDNYRINTRAFARHIANFNHALAERYRAFLDQLPEEMDYTALEERVLDCQDFQLHRLFLEYLPLTFSRRHGDPSRPWNLFDIRVNDAEGKRIIAYQGNWRDIFQNWEALSLSYPLYTNGIIAKFLNATTIDGYNPYKVTSEGIDWEVIEPENPWSNIGYWGDHQIIYLCRLLELSFAHHPQALRDMTGMREFAFANVPYRFKSYAEIVADPKNSIRFDDDLHKHIFALLPAYGQDARLVMGQAEQPLLVTMTEKLLITLLTKLSNLVPDAGVWMNTLRPEWNDANNALVGNGASMVTLCYMRRFVVFLQRLFDGMDTTYAVSREVVQFLYAILQATEQYLQATATLSDQARRQYTDAAGLAGEAYRNAAYAGFSGEKVELESEHIRLFLARILTLLDRSIASNRRPDGLYHAYNLIRFEGTQSLTISHLYEMLEGQVAILSSGYLSPAEAADLLDAMRASALYREDQRSYMLYPNRTLPSFFQKNTLTAEQASLPLVQRLLNTALFTQDCEGEVHFNADFRNASFLEKALQGLSISTEEKQQLLDLYEATFHHHAFTGRSGTFYKYEGLGCIYWHMVSKLLLAVGEIIETAGADSADFVRLKAHYEAIQEGIGAHKSPAEYGSFPFDPYSHTPAHAGCQQPGMTGQVKEDIISRFRELGLRVADGALHIEPVLLREDEFCEGALRFTYCAVPFTYRKSSNRQIVLRLSNGETVALPDHCIPAEWATHLFARDGVVAEVEVEV
ncbi:MAG: hypothetical protein SPE88_02435 [Paludibacteraceae bacterium]|nr:hypothetical protein [Paludibacteraceae bacterium]